MSDLTVQTAEAERHPSGDVVVLKFGGTSVEDASAIRRVSEILARHLSLRPVVVVSALAKVTDQLLHVGNLAAEGRLEAAAEIIQALRARHDQVAAELVDGDDGQRIRDLLANYFAELCELVRGIAAVREFTPRLRDALLGFGEHFSSQIVNGALLHAGFDVALVNACDFIVTDAAHTHAAPLWKETNERVNAVLGPLLEKRRIPLLGGYIGATRDGVPTTLGRGGSDFTAAIVGAALGACRIEIWTDVDGIMTTDPRLCSDARRIADMSFDEAAELSYFGAKVLHPATLLPAMRSNIPVFVLNSRNPKGKGTEIAAQVSGAGLVKAITAKRGIAVVDVEAVQWMAPELLREVCEVFERHQHSMELFSASRSGLSLLVTSTSNLPAIAADLQGVATVRWENHKALVCLVGEKIRRQPSIASQVFQAISDLEVRMICQGASERNITFLVDEAQVEQSVQRLHKLFFAGDALPA
jgi:aspartate kinase